LLIYQCLFSAKSSQVLASPVLFAASCTQAIYDMAFPVFETQQGG